MMITKMACAVAYILQNDAIGLLDSVSFIPEEKLWIS